MQLNVIYQGDCLEVLKELPDNSIDSVVTDPPYGLSKEPNIAEVLTKWLNGEEYDHNHGGFMGKSWDSFVPHPNIWKEVYRVLKPGGHILCFSGTRTQDLMTISLRLAGFEVRDVIQWIFFSGFSKGLNLSKAFDKRAGAKREVVAIRQQSKTLGFRYNIKELEDLLDKGITKTKDGRDVATALKYAKKGLQYEVTKPVTDLAKKWDGWGSGLKPSHEPIILCRKPIEKTIIDNVEQWGTGGLNIDGCRIEGDSWGTRPDSPKTNTVYGHYNPIVSVAHEKGRFPANCVTLEENEFFSEYFRVTPKELSKKASPIDRNSDWRGNLINRKNIHPTIKPVPLMAWLCRLITPKNGVVLDPFAGSGSTLVAAKREGFSFIGIEKEEEYIEIARERVGL